MGSSSRVFAVSLWLCAAAASPGQELDSALGENEWKAVEASVDRALAYLITQQNGRGMIGGVPAGQPAVTSLGVMAFLSRGHQPGAGAYGERLERATDFVLSCQGENGLLSYADVAKAKGKIVGSQPATYNHAIAGLMLGEIYGMVQGERSVRVKEAIGKALEVTFELQDRNAAAGADRGGMRYTTSPMGSDLSVTAWHLMFLRSAKNAGFDVPKKRIELAMDYVARCATPVGASGVFGYQARGGGASVAMTGAGALSLALGGRHGDERVIDSGEWMLRNPVSRTRMPRGRPYYSLYYCSQTMAQLGGKYWAGYFPGLSDALLHLQQADGKWLQGSDRYGNAYSTALAVLALTPAYQILPIYQR